jgi:DNA-binding Lrp family transcriptional regulator
MDETKPKRRGRPRSQETINRDKAILDLLRSDGPLKRREIADRLSINWSMTYLALERLRNDGKVKPCGGSSRAMVWTLEVDERCP